jgi:hypothetical protein
MQIICMMRLRLMPLLKFVLAALVMDGFTLALAMEVSPELHHKIHHDADDGDHDCLVTALQAGGCDCAMPLPPLVVIRWEPFLRVVPKIDLQWVAPLFLIHSVLEHAPPV